MPQVEFERTIPVFGRVHALDRAAAATGYTKPAEPKLNGI
jgi:hypothetical protein